MTTEHQRGPTPPEKQSAPQPKYERKIRENYSGQLDSNTEAALIWSGLLMGLDNIEGSEDPDDVRAGHSLRSQLKIFDTWNTDEVDFITHLEDTKSKIEFQIDNDSPTMARLHERRLAAVTEIMGTMQAQDDFLQQAFEGLDSDSARRSRTEYINGQIEQHNQFVDRRNGVAPETGETVRTVAEPIIPTQSREVQAKRADDARQEVDAAFGDTPEKKRASEILRQVIDAAKGAIYIHTDVPPIALSYGDEQHEPERFGFQTFGDAKDIEHRRANDFLVDRETTEAVLFAPDITRTYQTETYVVKTGLFGRKQLGERQVPSGWEPNMVVNRITGQQEPATRVSYQFYANGLHYGSDLPPYMTRSGRAGNLLIVETIVPQSTAEQFQQLIARNPALAREFAESLTRNNGVSEDAWSKGTPREHGPSAGEFVAPMRPPYDDLPSEWKLSVINKVPDNHSLSIASREDIAL